jgi:hypothetical protein
MCGRCGSRGANIAKTMRRGPTREGRAPNPQSASWCARACLNKSNRIMNLSSLDSRDNHLAAHLTRGNIESSECFTLLVIARARIIGRFFPISTRRVFFYCPCSISYGIRRIIDHALAATARRCCVEFLVDRFSRNQFLNLRARHVCCRCGTNQASGTNHYS